MSSNTNSRSRIGQTITRFFARQDDGRSAEVGAALKAVPFFEPLSKAALRTLADFVHVRDYRAQEFIYYDGDPGIGLYIVSQGRVSLILEEADGAVHELRSVGPAEVFGELSVLAGTRRMQTAQALEDTRVLGLFRPDMQTLIKRHPKAGAELLSVFARYLALREVAAVKLLSRQEGRLKALRLFDGITHADEVARDDSLTAFNG